MFESSILLPVKILLPLYGMWLLLLLWMLLVENEWRLETFWAVFSLAYLTFYYSMLLISFQETILGLVSFVCSLCELACSVSWRWWFRFSAGSLICSECYPLVILIALMVSGAFRNTVFRHKLVVLWCLLEELFVVDESILDQCILSFGWFWEVFSLV